METIEHALITEYRRHENLYIVQHRLYLDREAAKTSLEAICVTLGPTWTVEQVKKKIRSLRVRYTRSLKAHVASMKSGASADDVRPPEWKLFQEMDSFLRPHVQVRRGVNNMADEDCSEDCRVSEDIISLLQQTQEYHEDVQDDDSLLQGPSTSFAIPSPALSMTAQTPETSASTSSFATPCHFASASSKKRKRSVADKALETLKEVASRKHNAFGDFVVQELEKLPPFLQAKAQFEIHKVLLQMKNACE